jgi:LDH2 family malate/lactate/ureidoglycolate dehydrogenase
MLESSLVTLGLSLIMLGLSLVTPVLSLITLGLSLITLGPSLVMLGLSLITLESSLVTLGLSLITPEPSLVMLGLSLITLEQSLVMLGLSLITPEPFLVMLGLSLITPVLSLITPELSAWMFDLCKCNYTDASSFGGDQQSMLKNYTEKVPSPANLSTFYRGEDISPYALFIEKKETGKREIMVFLILFLKKSSIRQMYRIPRYELEVFCSKIFQALGVPPTDAAVSAQILVAADARGIKSHGVAHLKRYVDGIRAGMIKSSAAPTRLYETPLSLVLDAEGGVGLSLSRYAMGIAMDKAQAHGIGVCSVRNSNHFGIAGYYTEMAARNDMIGIAMTNTAALGVPTFARKAWFGTNPIAFAAPALDGKMFSLDMATTTITRGAVEVCEQEGREIPTGWAVGVDGRYTNDPVKLLDDMLYLRGGGLLPLGGEGTVSGGYKGYGLAVLVDVLCALTSGGTFGDAVRDSAITSARVCHFFMAIRLDIFRPPEEFKQDMTRMLDGLAALTPAEGQERVYYAGLRAQETERFNNEHGIPVSPETVKTLQIIAGDLNAGVTLAV